MSDLYKMQAEWLKTWQEGQEKLMKQYAGWGENLMENARSDMNKESDLFKGWFNPQGDLSGQFRDFSQRMNEMVNSVWGNKVPAGMLKFMDLSSFGELYKNWLSSLEWPEGMKSPLGPEGAWQQITDYFRSFMEKNNPYFSFFGNANVSDQINRVFGMLQGTMGREENFLNEIVKGYQDFFGKMFESTTAQSTEKLAEVFDAWAKEMEKQLSAPKLGINRELTHDLAQSLVLSQNYVQTYNKLTRLIEATGRKAAICFQNKLSEAALKNEPIYKFVDLCALWSVENENVFSEVMGSEEFAKLQGEFVDAGHRLKIHLNKLGERALEQTPVSLKRDLDLAIAEITQLKRDIRTLKRELRENEKGALTARAVHTAAVEEDAKKAKDAAIAAQEEAERAKAAATAAHQEAKNAKRAGDAAQEEAGKAKIATDVAQEEAKKAKAAGAAVKDPTKRMKTDSKTVKASLAAANEIKTRNV